MAGHIHHQLPAQGQAGLVQTEFGVVMGGVVLLVAGADEDEGGRNALGKGAEILADEQRRQTFHRAAEALLGQGSHQLGFARVIPGQVVAGLVVEFIAGPLGQAETGDKRFNFAPGKIPAPAADRAHATHEKGRAGNDVLQRAGLENGVGNHHGLLGRHAPGHQRLQQGYELGTEQHRVNGLLGQGRMAAPADDVEPVDVGIGTAGPLLDVDDAGGQAAEQMLAVDKVKIVEKARGQQFAGAAGRNLLGVLEDGVDFAAERVAVVGKVDTDGHQHGRVAVMAAGVHDAGGLGLEGQIRPFLLNGQGVQVGAQADFRPGPAGAEGHHQAGGGQADNLRPRQCAHFPGHEGAGLELLEGQLRVPVQMAAPVPGQGQIFIHFSRAYRCFSTKGSNLSGLVPWQGSPRACIFHSPSWR